MLYSLQKMMLTAYAGFAWIISAEHVIQYYLFG